MQRSRSEVRFHGHTAKKSSILTQIGCFRTVTPVWIQIWWWNDAQSLMLLRRGALFFSRSSVKFKVTRLKKSLILTQIGRFRTATLVWIHWWLWNDAQSLKQHRRGALSFFKVIRQISRSHGTKNRLFDPNWGFPIAFEFTDGFEMMHKAWCSTEDVPYHFSRSSIKFQGHTGWKIDNLDQIWARLLGRSQLSNPSELPCFVAFAFNVLTTALQQDVLPIKWRWAGRPNFQENSYLILSARIAIKGKRAICGLTSILARISNHMPSKVWDEITYPFLNFNGCTVEVWEWISIPHFMMDVMTDPCRD